jgi:hypothetical protein
MGLVHLLVPDHDIWLVLQVTNLASLALDYGLLGGFLAGDNALSVGRDGRLVRCRGPLVFLGCILFDRLHLL